MLETPLLGDSQRARRDVESDYLVALTPEVKGVSTSPTADIENSPINALDGLLFRWKRAVMGAKVGPY